MIEEREEIVVVRREWEIMVVLVLAVEIVVVSGFCSGNGGGRCFGSKKCGGRWLV